jgi:hypothetical protein
MCYDILSIGPGLISLLSTIFTLCHINNMNISPHIQHIDQLLKNANYQQALLEFKKLTVLSLKRESLLEVCHLARRIGFPYFILKKLNPIIDPDKNLKQPATNEEKALYAHGLSRIGAFQEAQSLLTRIPDNIPEKHFYIAQNLMHQWKYHETISHLKKYAELLSEHQYEFWICQVNLLSAYSFTQNYELANSTIENLLSGVQSKYPLLHANSLEIYSQILLHTKRYTEARNRLEQASHILKNSNSNYELFVKKWNLIIDMLEYKLFSDSAFNQTRELAIKKQSFETLREIDFYKSICTSDLELFSKVYSGTRFYSYRQKMKNQFQVNKINPKIKFMEENLNSDIEPTNVDLQNVPVTLNQKKLLYIILSDFYSPIQLGEAFRKLYPNEYFNPYSSELRLYRHYENLKKSLYKLNYPLEIHWKNRRIFWTQTNPFYLIRSSNAKIRKPLFKKIKILDGVISQLSVSFNRQEISLITGWPQRTTDRILNIAVNNKIIKKTKPGFFKKIKKSA